MVWLLAALWFLSILTCWLFHLLLVREMRRDHSEQRATWELKEERLLNRCMTKDWQSYVQLQSLQESSTSFPAIEGEGIGLSEESEARAWAEAHGLSDVGEVVYEQDFRDLGLVE